MLYIEIKIIYSYLSVGMFKMPLNSKALVNSNNYG